eukprot:m.64468 g.64468  ORF g.64468 m.64468 type:complete len:92 (-) comp8227_c0_seq1:199-474(-)
MAMRGRALAAFRSVMRAREELFKGDAEMLDISRTKALAEFRANRDLTDEDDIEHAIKTAEDVVIVLRHNVVQAKLDTETGRYRTRIHDKIL